MSVLIRKRRTLHLPITLSVVLMGLNIALMVCWIVFLAKSFQYTALTIGTVLFALVLVGLTIYLVLSIKSIRLHQRQVNFVDSVTHELKSPIAAVRLYLDTLRLRQVTLDAAQRAECYEVMEAELTRLELLINQLLEVGRLERIGEESDPEDVALTPLLERSLRAACTHHKVDEATVFELDMEPAVVHARPLVLEMMFGNLLDNAVKYAGDPPKVDVQVRVRHRRVIVRVADNGPGVPRDQRKKIFDLFYRGGNELERTRKGTGLGLYIVRTLVHFLKGRVTVYDRFGQTGSIFEVDLPGRSM
ncbi:MAG: HAMP domain-containing histidine kinase [Planctomycetota bacterium]|nr:HAMP domain-containing histidine kinase [Planctomycetaceae bacterium]MDQ3331164.1 HAMP domain-containing histidine kinase [Planctomycetota bacterium]